MATDKDKKEAKLKAKREKIKSTLGTGYSSNEPVIDPLNYTASLMKALNYYNASNDNKEKRKWFLTYVGKQNAAKFADIESDFQFRSAGTLARLKMRDQYLEDRELITLDNEVKRLELYTKNKAVSSIKGAPVDKPTKPVVSIQDRIAESASEHIAEFNHMFDEYFTKDIEPDFASYLKANNVSGAVSKLIPPAFIKLWNELQELLEGNDKQLIEGYSHIKKTKIKKICKFIEELETACAQQVVSAKVVRKPRVKKEKPPSVIAKSVKYMKEFAELSLVSEKPEKIVGASEVLIYNTKYKKVQIYRAIGDSKLSIKGTTITGYEVANSSSKTLRKPEQIKDFAGMTKRTFATAYKSLKTKEAAVNGRINEDCIIVKVY